MNDDINKHGKPHIIPKPMEMTGFATNTGFAGDQVMVLQKASLTSLNYDFYKFAQSIQDVFGIKPSWNLLIRSDDKETKIFEDNFPVVLQVRTKRPLKTRQVVMTGDIADITAASLSDVLVDVNPQSGEKVICIISNGYMHGLYFDFTGRLKAEDFKKDLGFLYRDIRYAHIYVAIDAGIIDKMITVGWFPFVQLLGTDCQNLIGMVAQEQEDKIERWSENEFTNDRVKSFTGLWQENKAFIKKERQCSEGLDCFYKGSYVAAISTLTPLLEGILNEYLIQKTSKGTSYSGDEIADKIYESALEMADGQSILMPEKFKNYLNKYFFKHTKSSTSKEAVRHAVGHGRAEDSSFTRERALQVILTLDQLFFYIRR